MPRKIIKKYEDDFMVCKDCLDLIVFGAAGEDVLMFTYQHGGAEELIEHIYASYDKMRTVQIDGKDHHLEFATVNDDKYLEFSKKRCDCCNRNLAGERHCLEFYE